MTDRTHQQPTAVAMPRPLRRGILLPSMRWTEDREEVEREKQRLLALQGISARRWLMPPAPTNAPLGG